MEPVSGFVLENDRRLYLAGDTVWYGTIPETLDRHDPDTVAVNAGAAHNVDGDPTTIEADDVDRVREHSNDSLPVVADHVEATNHCLLTRETLRAAADGVTTPGDRETATV